MVQQTGIATLGSYNDTLIECRPSDEFINATAMCQATGKRWGTYWQNQQTQEFVNALERNVGIPTFELVQSNRGQNGGTWVHRRVAIHLAQWCSPDFAVWVSGQIEAIMTGRQVAHREHAEFAISRIENNVDALHQIVSSCVEEMVEIRKEQQDQNKKLMTLWERWAPAIEAIQRIDERTQGKREGFSSEVTKQFVHCVEKFYSGKCPCCMLRVVVENGKRVPHIAQVDHYHHRSMNRMEHGWLVCKTCNTKLKNRKPNGFWFQSGPAFHSFQQRLHQSDQLLLFSEDGWGGGHA
jgi:hypothetical protein